MMAIPMAIAAAGSVVGGLAQNAQAKREAAIDDANANIAEQQAQSDAAAVRDKAVRLRGQQLAQTGASGIDTSGFMDAISDSDIQAELDAQNTEYNGKIKASNFRSQAAMSRESGDAALVSGLFGAGSNAMSAYAAWRR
jgi:hypothetical protein